MPEHDLASGEVHVWILDIEDQRPAWDSLLTPAETAASRRMAPTQQLRFKNRRAALRLLLGRYLQLSPTSIEFAATTNGKLYLVGDKLAFNVSHSGNVAVIAVGRGCEIGVDIERVRSLSDSRALAEKFFTMEEADALSGLGTQPFDRTFLTLWTRKEAVLKACGKGIADGITESVPSYSPVNGAEMVLASGETLFIYDIAAGQDYVASLALSRRAFRVAEMKMQIAEY